MSKEQLIVNVLVNNDRQKKHPKASDANPNIYLKDGEEFELEFISQYKKQIGITISINGKLLSDRRLLIDPGERIILDRFIENNKRLKFSTYDLGVEDDEYTEQSKTVYEESDMGQIEVNVYKTSNIQPINEPYIYNSFTNGNGNIMYTNMTSTGDPNVIGSYVRTPLDPNYKSFFSSEISFDFKLDNNTYSIENDIKESKMKKKQRFDSIIEKTVEGGKITEGSVSGQKFVNTEVILDTLSTETVRIRLKPLSTKPITKKDLVCYCTNCGKKAKQQHNFCSSCGTKL